MANEGKDSLEVEEEPTGMLLIQQPTVKIHRIEGEYARTIHIHEMKSDRLSFGTEMIGVGFEVPWHQHEEAEEILYCLEGKGRVELQKDDARRNIEFVPGVMVHVAPTVRHRIVNTHSYKDLELTFTLSPPRTIEKFRATDRT